PCGRAWNTSSKTGMYLISRNDFHRRTAGKGACCSSMEKLLTNEGKFDKITWLEKVKLLVWLSR
ncbi:MAG: hypothetical protein MJ085_01970, partial [Clostridia bacterium]|nr:hypothetical protein [Clostridia bacterium]